MPSQSVEAATRDEAIAAAREQFGPTARVVGVRRIRSGGMFGFFANERYIAEVEVGKAAAGTGPDTGSVLKSAENSRAEAPAPSMDDRMRELADLLGSAAQESPSAGLYGRSGGAAASSPVSSAASAASAAGAARPAGRSAAPSARAGKSATASATPRSAAATKRAAAGPRPFTPAKHTLMLAPEDLAPGQHAPAEPVAEQPSGPSPFAAALTRMVASNPVQAAADAAADAAAEAAAEKAAAEAAAVAQAAAVESAAAEAARTAAARIEAAAAEAARLRAEAAAAEAARLRAEAAAAEAARLQAEADAEAARLQAEAAAEAARIEAARIEAARIETERLQAEAEAEAARIEAAAAAAAEAARLQAEAAAVEAAAVEAAAVKAAAAEAELEAEAAAAEVHDAPVLSMVESVRTADEELAALLEEVLAANGSGRGRHRLPEAGAEIGPEAAAESAVPAVAAGAVAEERVLDVPEPWAYETAAREPSAYDTGAYRTDAYSPAWASDARVAQRAAQVAAAQNLVVDAVVVDESPAEEIRYVEPRPVELVEEERFALPLSLAPALSPALARTASDPAPLPMDATMILPPLSLMPPQRFGGAGGTPPLLSSRPGVPPVRRGRPPVPTSRPAVSSRPHAPTRPVQIPVPIAARPVAEALPAAEETGTRLATVTRLVPAVSSSSALTPFSMTGPEELVVRLLTLGLPDFLLGPDFTADAANRGVYAALTRTLAERLPVAPQLPAEPGAVLMVVGPGAETLAAARSLALSLRLEPENVQWAASGALAALAPEASRITSLDTAVERRKTSSTTGTVTIVAVDAPLRTSGGPWLEHMLSVWSPTAVWAVLDSTRKPEDLVPWLDGLPALDAVVVQDTDSTADPAAVLSHVSVPVALVDGTRATAHRWASLLCERLEEMEA